MSDARLHVVARAATQSLGVHVLGEQVFVTSERNLAELRGERLEVDPLRAAGLFHCASRTIHGVYVSAARSAFFRDSSLAPKMAA